MKTNKIVLPVLACLLLIGAALSFAFTTVKTKKPASTQLIVAIGVKNVDCNGLTVEQAVCYYHIRRSSDQNYTTTVENLKEQLRGDYSVDNINVYTTYSDYAAVYKYSKKISGWGCTVGRIMVGFGNSEDAAADHAISKIQNESGTQYSALKNINNF